MNKITEDDKVLSNSILELLTEQSSLFREQIFNPKEQVLREPAPFELRNIEGETVIFLPQNFMEIVNNPFKTGMSSILASSKFVFKYTKKELLTRVSEEAENFFIGYFRTITRSPEENETVNFSSGNAINKGATQAKLMILRILMEDYSKIANFLPNECFYSEARIDFISFFLSEMIIEKDIPTLKVLKENILRILMRFLRSSNIPSKWSMLETYLIPCNKVLEGLYQTKEKMVKGKKKFVAIKPKRPSRRIEIIYPEERQYIEYSENCFSSFKKISDSIKGGCPMSKVIKVREELFLLTQMKREVVKKFSAPLSYRRKVFERIIKDHKLKKNMNKGNLEIILNLVKSDEVSLSPKERIDMSSYNILVSCKCDGRLLNGFKAILEGKSLKISSKKIYECENNDTMEELLDSNLAFLYKDNESPNYKRYYDFLKGRTDIDPENPTKGEESPFVEDENH
jgi:hypothetical protein